MLRRPTLSQLWVRLLWRTRHLRWPLAVWSMVPFAFMGLAPLAFYALFLHVFSWFVPRPWCVRRPPGRRSSSFNTEGQRWLRQELQRNARSASWVYVLWSEEQWAVRSAALPRRSSAQAGLPWQPRRRFFTRGPV